MSQILHILQYKIRTGIKIKFDLQLNTIVKNIGSVIVFGGFAVGAYSFAFNVTSYLIEDLKIGQFLLHRFLSMFLFVFFVTICLGNILVAFSTLFRSAEVRFLFTQPVSHFKIFIVKFLDNFFYSSTTFFLMGFSVIAGYGTYLSHPWYVYPLIMFGVFIPFMFLAACIAGIILLLILRLTEYISIKYLAGIFVIGYLTVIYLFFQSVSPVALVNDVLEYFPDVDRSFTHFDPWFFSYLPSHWVAELLYWYVQGSTVYVLLNTAQLLACVVAFLGALLLIGRKLYYRSWLLTIDSREGYTSSKTAPRFGLLDLTSASVIPQSVSVILKRDILRYLREPSQWVHLLLTLLLVTVFLYSVRGMEVELFDPFLMTVMYLVLFIFNAFLLSAIALRFVYPMTSLEGEALWALRSAPLNMRNVLFIKGMVSVLFLTFVGQIITYVTIQSIDGSGSLLLFSAIAQVWVVFTIVSLNLGLGSYFAQYNEKNPIRIASSQGASLTFLMGMLYLILSVLLYLPFLTRYFEHSVISAHVNVHWIAPPLVITAAVSFGVGLGALVLGVRAVTRDAEF